MILFGAFVGLLEFQIPPQVSRYASFMFSFIGRGLCMCLSVVFSPATFLISRGITIVHLLTDCSLHFRRLNPAFIPLVTLRRWRHHRTDRPGICGTRVRALDRTTGQHARGRSGLGCRAGVMPNRTIHTYWKGIILLTRFMIRPCIRENGFASRNCISCKIKLLLPGREGTLGTGRLENQASLETHSKRNN